MRYILLLTITIFACLLVVAQTQGLALLIVEPATYNINLTSSDIGSLLLVVSNIGEEPAANVSLQFVASGCVELLDEKGVWSTNLTLMLGDVAVGVAKRVFVPVRCRGGSGIVSVSVLAMNADPSFTSVRVYAPESAQKPVWAWVAVGLLVVASAAYMARRRLKRRSSKTRGKEQYKAQAKRVSTRKRSN